MRPITYGPANPARLPIELISAIPPAAAAPDRNAAGNVQKTGRQPKIPKPATDNAAIFIVGSSSAVEIAIPADATNSGNARWNRRSSIRSERRPQNTMLTSPAIYGTAAPSPAWQVDTPNAFTIWGRQTLNP